MWVSPSGNLTFSELLLNSSKWIQFVEPGVFGYDRRATQPVSSDYEFHLTLMGHCTGASKKMYILKK